MGTAGNWSAAKNKYVILGVTGPNEYENNVNNNWYTNYIAVWTLKYAQQAVEYVKAHDGKHYQEIVVKTKFNENEESAKWGDIVAKMYFGEDKNRGIFLQQDCFLDKELLTVHDLNPEDRPINQAPVL